jgi:hypothetical protein
VNRAAWPTLDGGSTDRDESRYTFAIHASLAAGLCRQSTIMCLTNAAPIHEQELLGLTPEQ